jgi:MOSC domain-containing protein YiiM
MNPPNAVAHVLAVHSSDRHAFSKPSKDAIRLIENWGVEGDAHAGPKDQHLYHIRRFGEQPNLRQVHLIHAELLDAVRAKGHTVLPGQLGENISTRNLDLLGLPQGTRLRIGAQAVVELTGLRNPCRQIDEFQPGLRSHLVERTDAGVVRRGGVMAIVLEGGTVRPGDRIEVELPPPPHAPLVYRMPE